MAKGYPDFFGQSVFPRYGSLIRQNTVTVIPADGTDNVFTLEAKGSINSGTIALASADYEAIDTELQMTIDGNLMGLFYPTGDYIVDPVLRQKSAPLFYTEHDAIQHRIWLGFHEGINFNTSLELDVINYDAVNSINFNITLYYFDVL